MGTSIRIVCGGQAYDAVLNESETAEAIASSLPLESHVNRWGHEIYAHIDVELDLAPDARDVLQVGELAYWPPGQAFCIFFGATPASANGEPRAAGPVNPIGRVAADAEALDHVADGVPFRLELR